MQVHQYFFLSSKIMCSILFLISMGCGSPNNTLEGFSPDNPISNPTPLPVDKSTKTSGLISMAQKNTRTNNGLKLSAALGDQLPAKTKTTTSGHFKVVLTVQGQLNSIK